MNNEIHDNEMYNSTSIEIKESFFSKLFSSFGRKALPSADGVVRTNASMSSLIARGSLRASLINIGNKIQNIFTSKKEIEPQSTLTAQVIGENYKSETEVEKTLEDENSLYSEQPKIVIPTTKTIVRNTSIINNNQPPKLTVEKIDIDSDAILENAKIDNNTLAKENSEITQGIQAVTMTVNDKNKKLKEDINRISKPEVTHELDF